MGDSVDFLKNLEKKSLKKSPWATKAIFEKNHLGGTKIMCPPYEIPGYITALHTQFYTNNYFYRKHFMCMGGVEISTKNSGEGRLVKNYFSKAKNLCSQLMFYNCLFV